MLFRSGRLCYDGEWGNNVANGSGRLYYESGQLCYSGSFVNGTCTGAGRLYSKDGTLYHEGRFHNGEPVADTTGNALNFLNSAATTGRSLTWFLDLLKEAGPLLLSTVF